jgi:hypothetical protein
VMYLPDILKGIIHGGVKPLCRVIAEIIQQGGIGHDRFGYGRSSELSARRF